jgi:predicted Zn-dependent peptidase
LVHAYQKTVLPNGLRIVTATVPYAYSVAVSVYIGAGSRYEEDAEAGISHFVEHMCFKGTETLPTALDIAEVVDAIGGHLNGGTDRELTVFYAKVASNHFSMALRLLLDLVSCPLFDPREMEKERRVILEELASVEDSPPQLAFLLADSALWPDNPLGRDVAGTRESVEAITREQALAYLRRQYVASNMVVAVAGRIDHQEVVDAVWQWAGRWPAGQPGRWIPARNGAGPRVRLRYKETEQAHICLVAHGLPLNHPDRYALGLLSVVLGEGMSSRLFLELREKRGLVYEVHSSVNQFLDAGALSIYAATDPDQADEVVALVLEELERLRSQGLAETELNRARELAKGRLLLRLEDTRSLSGWLGGQELLLGSVRTPEEVLASMEAVTPDDVQRLAGQLLRPEDLRLALVGPFRSEERFASLLGA